MQAIAYAPVEFRLLPFGSAVISLTVCSPVLSSDSNEDADRVTIIEGTTAHTQILSD